MDKFNEMLALASALAVIVPLVISAVKSAFNLPNNVLPLVAILLGAVLGGLSIPLFPQASVFVLIWAGAIAGAGGVGIREVVKNRDGYTKDSL